MRKKISIISVCALLNAAAPAIAQPAIQKDQEARQLAEKLLSKENQKLYKKRVTDAILSTAQEQSAAQKSAEHGPWEEFAPSSDPANIRKSAEYYREHYAEILDAAAAKAERLHPGDPRFAAEARKYTLQRMNDVIKQQELMDHEPVTAGSEPSIPDTTQDDIQSLKDEQLMYRHENDVQELRDRMQQQKMQNQIDDLRRQQER